MNLVDLRSPIP